MSARMLIKVTGGSQVTVAWKAPQTAHQSIMSQPPGSDLHGIPPPCGGHTSPAQLLKGTSTSLFRLVPPSRGEFFHLAKACIVGQLPGNRTSLPEEKARMTCPTNDVQGCADSHQEKAMRAGFLSPVPG